MQETKKQHHEIVSVYRMHLLYAVQVNSGSSSPFGSSGTFQVITTKVKMALEALAVFGVNY